MLILQMGLCKYVCLNVDWVKQTVGLKMAKNQEKESFESAKEIIFSSLLQEGLKILCHCILFRLISAQFLKNKQLIYSVD